MPALGDLAKEYEAALNTFLGIARGETALSPETP
jgi:hypothetical protein